MARLPVPPATLNSLSQQTYGILDFCWNGFAATESFYNKYDPKDHGAGNGSRAPSTTCRAIRS